MANDSDFARAVAFVLHHEGGYVANPADPGGETKYGISKRSYPDLDIAALTEADARAIYYTDYWPTAANLPMPLAMVVFDTAVNMGRGVAQSLLTKSGGDVERYLELRGQRYDAIVSAKPQLGVFLAGWRKRVAALASAASGTTGLVAIGVLLLGALLVLRGRA